MKVYYKGRGKQWRWLYFSEKYGRGGQGNGGNSREYRQ